MGENNASGGAVPGAPALKVAGPQWKSGKGEPEIPGFWLGDRFYVSARRDNLDLGFQESLLGAAYAAHWWERPVWLEHLPPRLAAFFRKKRARSRFYAVTRDLLRDDAGQPVPLFTVAKTDEGQGVVLELNPDLKAREELYFSLVLYSLVQANSPYSRHRFDAYGDFMRLGAASQVDRHNSELARKRLGQRISFEAADCTHCLKCATSCSEMQVRLTPAGLKVLGPVEDYCTVCRLCLEHCPHLFEVRKEDLPPEKKAAPLAHFTGGEATYLTGEAAREVNPFLQNLAESGGVLDGWRFTPVYQGAPWAADHPPGVQLNQYSLEDRRPDSSFKPLLVTLFLPPEDSPEPPLMILRLMVRAAVFLTTPAGEMERDLGRSLEGLGVLYQGVVDREKFGSGGAHPLVPELYRLGRLAREAHLADLVQGGQVDVVVSPYQEALPAPVVSYFLEKTGGMAHLLAPQVYQAFTFSHEPLLNEIREVCLEVFPRYPQLLAQEAELARGYLADLPRHAAAIHARYRTWGIAPGHSACPTCAELQTLAVPLYMAMLLSLARGQVPQVTFTCETGCMSETLNKVNEVAQKVRGGRTVFGGGMAFAEAAARFEEWAMSRGALPLSRRYVVSQSGDGGAVIGLPALLNALRQRAFLVKDREAQVLHFINVTDTQVYSNTGGESSATSMLGMSTLTTPMGRFLVGNQRIQWQLINLAAEFPGILVGLGHCGHKEAMQEFWAQADRLGRSAIRWDVTLCPETGKFFGEDPDQLARVMAHVGMLPEVVFVGRLRKRVAPINPGDRHRNWREWSSPPQPIYYWLARDPRYRPLIRQDPVSDAWEPISPAVRAIIAQLERFRDNLNRQIDLENRLVREAEKFTAEFFHHLNEEWRRAAQMPEDFPYHFLFNAVGELKPEFGKAFQREFLEAVLGQDYVVRYAVARDEQWAAAAQAGEAALAAGGAAARCGAEVLPPPLPLEWPWLKGQGPYRSVAEARRAEFYRLLDRLLDERAITKQAQISQYILKKELARDFESQGGIFTQEGAALAAPARREFRAALEGVGDFALGVASLAGERGIALNRLFSQFFTGRGAWAGMAWQFGSSKRGTPVFSGTFVSPRPIQRKDALLSFPFYVLTVTNYGDLKAQPDIFYDSLHPQGYLIINTPLAPEAVHRELLACYDEHLRQAVARAQATPKGEVREVVSQFLFEAPASALNPEQQRLVTKVLALAQARVVTTDMDGIMAQAAGSTRVVSNLVAVAPMMRALEILGLPVNFEADLPGLLAGFPGAVKKNKRLVTQYLEAMHRAYQESKGFPPAGAQAAPPLAEGPAADPGDYYLEMGGTLAGMVLSQLALPSHPLFYIGFPITPAGNPFYAMAQAYANGHPYLIVDENNPSEKVAAEKLLGVARTGGALPVTFTASQGWRLFAEIMPQLVGSRLECLFVLTRRALAAPALNIEESHTDFMTFRDDGAIMLSPKSTQELVPCLYLARLLTHFARLPVVASLGGITDTHKIGLVKVPPDRRVRAGLERVLMEFDFLEDKLLNRQGEVLVHGPSGTAEVYQETQSEVEKAHALALRVFPVAVRLVEELTGYRFEELEVTATAPGEPPTTALVLTGSFYPNAEEAIQELAREGWRELAAVSVRLFNPFPEETLATQLASAQVVTIMDRSNSFGSVPPLASRVINALARHRPGAPPVCRTLVGGLGGREITVGQLKELLKFSHLFLVPRPPADLDLRRNLLEGDALLQGMLAELAALEERSMERHTRVPASLRTASNSPEHREKLARALVRGDYVPVLANYGAVEFIGPKEVWEETRLIKQLIIRLERLLARELIRQGRADWRAAVTLLEYSGLPADYRLALEALEQMVQAAPPAAAWALYRLGSGYGHKFAPFGLALNEPAAPEPETIPASEAPPGAESPGAPAEEGLEIPFDPAEAARLKAVLHRLVAENATRETLRNPEDLEREALALLARDASSALSPYPEEAGRLAYQNTYTGVIDRALAEEILGQHYAPELKEIFGRDGLSALALVVQATVAYQARRPEGEALDQEKVAREAALEVERYLREEVYPRYRRDPGFYHDFYRAWVEPEVKQLIAREVVEAT